MSQPPARPSALAGEWKPLIGVLALQGDVAEHVLMLNRIGARTRLVKVVSDLANLDGLVLPVVKAQPLGSSCADLVYWGHCDPCNRVVSRCTDLCRHDPSS